MAMTSCRSRFLTMFAAVVVVVLDQADGGDPWGRSDTSVVIENELPDVLAVHCYSKDDNLGLHYLQPRGAPYGFSFHANFWGSTLFWCTLNHGAFAPGSQWNSFPVWTDHGLFGKRERPCDRCVWIVRTDAFYRVSASGLPIAVEPWRNDMQR